MSARHKGMADGLNKPLQLCLSPAVESGGCLQVEEEEEDCPENSTEKKFPPLPVGVIIDIAVWCACLSLGDGECPLLGMAVLSHPRDLTLLTRTLAATSPVPWTGKGVFC